MNEYFISSDEWYRLEIDLICSEKLTETNEIYIVDKRDYSSFAAEKKSCICRSTIVTNKAKNSKKAVFIHSNFGTILWVVKITNEEIAVNGLVMAFFGVLSSLFSKKGILVVSVFETKPIFGLQLFFEKPF